VQARPLGFGQWVDGGQERLKSRALDLTLPAVLQMAGYGRRVLACLAGDVGAQKL
jgi:hypothetical protein